MARAPSAALVARTKLAKSDSINRFIEKEWLPEVGDEIKRRVGGSSKVAFKQGYVVWVTTGNPEAVEVIGIRVSSYRHDVTLYHVLNGESDLVDSMDLAEAMKMTASQMADWAVDGTKGRAQTELPFSSREREGRLRARAEAIVREEAKKRDMTWKQRQKRVEEVMEEERRRTGYRG